MSKLSGPQKACLRAALTHGRLYPDRYASVYETPDGSRFHRPTVEALLRLKCLRKTRDGRLREITPLGMRTIQVADFHI